MGEKNNDIEKLSDDKVDEVGVEDSTESSTEESPVEDGSSIVRVDNAWQQSKGSKISSDGFHKKDHSTITMPKDIDITTPEGDKRAGKFVEEIKAAKKRGQKLQAAAERDAWDNRKVQVIVDKDVPNGD